ncbi:MAG: sulfite exporter TauE/SafE family protein [Pseudomonadota bacterium]
MISDPQFIWLGAIAILLVGVSKGGFGGSTGVLATPLLAVALPLTTAAAIMLPILALMDIVAMRAFWGRWSMALLRTLVPAGIVGIIAGALSFQYLDADSLRILIGVLAVIFALQSFAREFRPQKETRSVLPGTGLFWGALSGYTSFVAHAGGPPATIHLLALRLDRTVHQATAVFFFLIVNWVKIIPYTALGLFTRDTLIASAVLAPLAPAGVLLGAYLHKRVNQAWFLRITTIGLFATGVKLLWPA